MKRDRARGLLVTAVTLLACGGEDPPTGPTTGTILVTVATVGQGVPADYRAVLDETTSRPVTINGSVLFTGVDEGEHSVALTDVPANCSVTSPNPAAVTVTGGATTTVEMAVSCFATEGAIQVSAQTTGEALDPDGYLVSVDGGGPAVLDVNGSVSFSGLPAGDHEVVLTGVAGNCTLTGTSTRTVPVVVGETATVSFEIACAANSSIVFSAGDIYSIQPDGTGLTLLTPPEDGVGGLVPIWSPDGSRIAFQSDESGSAEIYVVNRDGTEVAPVVAYLDGVCCDYVWSPDGNRLAFSDGAGGAASIYVVDATGANLTKVTENPAADRAPTWSPDGTQIAFERYAGEFGGPELYRVDADGTDEVQLTSNPEYDEEPTWSPDGSRIAFRRGYDEGGESYSAIYTMTPDGSDLLNVSGGPGNDEQPVWSPDGTRIAFVGERAGNADLYVVSADGSGLVRLTEAPEKDEWPSWSPDGTRLVFCRRIELGQLFIVNADGSGEVQLQPGGCTPDWSPYLP